MLCIINSCHYLWQIKLYTIHCWVIGKQRSEQLLACCHILQQCSSHTVQLSRVFFVISNKHQCEGNVSTLLISFVGRNVVHRQTRTSILQCTINCLVGSMRKHICCIGRKTIRLRTCNNANLL